MDLRFPSGSHADSSALRVRGWSSSSLPDRGVRLCGVVQRKRWIDIAMLDAHDTKMRIFVGRRTDRVVSRIGSDVKALGARIRRVNERLAAKDHTICIHINSPTGLRCDIAGT